MRALLRLIVWTLVILGLAIGLARATAIRWWRVPTDDPWLSASVGPTLQPGDWVLLWRLTRPSDGDLVQCPEPKAPERIVIGRILGSGNDELTFGEGNIVINGKALRTERSCDAFEVLHPRTGATVRQGCSVEDMGGRLFMRGSDVASGNATQTPLKVVVNPGDFYLVSDNRQFPFDSRDFGPVAASSCRETIVFRLWGRNGYFDQQRRFDLIR